MAGTHPAMLRLPLLHAQLDALLAIRASHLPLCCYVGLLHRRSSHLLLCVRIGSSTLRSAESTVGTQDVGSLLQPIAPGYSDNTAPCLEFLLIINSILLWHSHAQQVFIRCSCRGCHTFSRKEAL